jgi:hypothetical protein
MSHKGGDGPKAADSINLNIRITGKEIVAYYRLKDGV